MYWRVTTWHPVSNVQDSLTQIHTCSIKCGINYHHLMQDYINNKEKPSLFHIEGNMNSYCRLCTYEHAYIAYYSGYKTLIICVCMRYMVECSLISSCNNIFVVLCASVIVLTPLSSNCHVKNKLHGWTIFLRYLFYLFICITISLTTRMHINCTQIHNTHNVYKISG